MDEPYTDAVTLQLESDGSVRIWSSVTNTKTEAQVIDGYGELNGEDLSLTVTYTFPTGDSYTVNETGFLSADRSHLDVAYGEMSRFLVACG